MNSLMNDTEATLLSHAYANPATRISLIWGTGLNAALQLPISVISPLKLGRRPREFTDVAKAVLVNTEVSMFGAGLFPLISADEELDRQSPLPGFQPLEYLTSGRYLGEIFRLALVEGVEVGTLFDGAMPKGLDEKFGFDTALMSHIETSSIEEATSLLTSAFSFTQPPEPTDIQAVRSLARAIASRAGVYIAITIFTLWRLQRDSLSANPSTRDAFSRSTGPVAVAYCGAVVEKHPSVRRQCQDALDILVQTEPGLKIRRRLVLEEAADSGVLGAAVGAVMNDIEDVQKEQQLIRARL